MFDIFNKVGETLIEKMFLDMLKDFSTEDLGDAVKNNTSLLDETTKYRPWILRTGERLAKQFNSYKDFVTTENVLIWLKQKRFDFYFTIISDPKKKAWLDKQVEEVCKFLFDY